MERLARNVGLAKATSCLHVALFHKSFIRAIIF